MPREPLIVSDDDAERVRAVAAMLPNATERTVQHTLSLAIMRGLSAVEAEYRRSTKYDAIERRNTAKPKRERAYRLGPRERTP